MLLMKQTGTEQAITTPRKPVNLQFGFLKNLILWSVSYTVHCG